jgi:methionyl-tRNA formyltransferase
MRVVFIGTVEFSVYALKKLIGLNVDIVGVCTKEESTFNSDFSDLKPLCIINKIPWLLVDNINSHHSARWIKNLNPDIVFCFGWSSLIKKEVLNIAPMGVVGYHPAALPKNRGRHPLIWTLALGLENSASTFFFMDEGADTGGILSQVDFEVSYQDDAQSIYKKVVDTALYQIEKFIPELEENSFITIKQIDNNSNVWRKRNESDGQIDFRMSSRAIYDLTRALTKPYVGAHIKYNGKNYSVWKVKEINSFEENIESGKILSVDRKSFIVKSYDGAVEIIKHDFKILPKVGEYL